MTEIQKENPNYKRQKSVINIEVSDITERINALVLKLTLKSEHNKSNLNLIWEVKELVPEMEKISELLNQRIINNYPILKCFIEFLTSLLDFIKENSEEILLLKKVKLEDFRKVFMGIEEEIRRMCYSRDFIGTIIKNSNLENGQNITNNIDSLYDYFEKIYYIINPERKAYSRRLNTKKILSGLNKKWFIDDDLLFFEVIADIRWLNNFSLWNNNRLTKQNKKQLLDTKTDVNLIIKIIDELLKEDHIHEFSDWNKRSELTKISKGWSVNLNVLKNMINQINSPKKTKDAICSKNNGKIEWIANKNVAEQIEIFDKVDEWIKDIPNYMKEKNPEEIEKSWRKDISMFDLVKKTFWWIINPLNKIKNISNEVLSVLKEKLLDYFIKLKNIFKITKNENIEINTRLIVQSKIGKKILWTSVDN